MARSTVQKMNNGILVVVPLAQNVLTRVIIAKNYRKKDNPSKRVCHLKKWKLSKNGNLSSNSFVMINPQSIGWLFIILIKR